MKKYHSKPAQQATYIRVYEGDRRLQGAEVISVIHGLQAEVEQQTQRAEKAEGDLSKANERVAELDQESLAFRSVLDQSNRFHPDTDKMYSSGFNDAMRLFEDIYLGGAQQALNKFAIEKHDEGVDACIAELTRCYRVALDESNDIDDANSIEVLIDHLQQLRKEQEK